MENGHGCPEEYSSSNFDYDAGDMVAFTVSTSPKHKVVYECLGWPNSHFCNQVSYAPGGMYGHMAWTNKGFCDGTISPTASPVVFMPGISCTYSKCENQETPCTCSSSGCPTTNGQTANCKKTSTVCNDTDVDPYSSSVVYKAGDVVRIGANMFKCKGYPYTGWCSQSGYAPDLKPNIWSNAWDKDGTCAPLPSMATLVTFFSSLSLSSFD